MFKSIQFEDGHLVPNANQLPSDIQNVPLKLPINPACHNTIHWLCSTWIQYAEGPLCNLMTPDTAAQ